MINVRSSAQVGLIWLLAYDNFLSSIAPDIISRFRGVEVVEALYELLAARRLLQLDSSVSVVLEAGRWQKPIERNPT